MNYEDSLKFIYEKLPMYHKIGSAAYKPGLQNIEHLCRVLNNPQKKFKSIHVAGTNGKGSTSHIMAAILQCEGYKTGLFTSPHLKNFTERIKINGEEATRNFVASFITGIKDTILEIQPSFFEITTAMAFQYFAEQEVDWAIIEVGLGGRLDSTNIITPELCIITNISYDHTDLLGSTLAEIAAEKAGIIKPGIPVVISETQAETKDIFINKANAVMAPIHFTDHIHIIDKGLSANNRLVDIVMNEQKIYIDLACSLPGKYQLKNLKGILEAKNITDNQLVTTKEETMVKALLEVKTLTGLKGRWHILNESPLTICDTGHNEGGINEIVDQLKSTKHEKLFIVIGMVKDKDHDRILQLLPKEAHYFFTHPAIERGFPAEELAKKAAKFGLLGAIIPEVNDAIRQAEALAAPNDLIFIGGSTFVVAEIEGL